MTFRILTLKSKFGFGKYGDLTVQSIVNRKNFAYIKWVYYHTSHISFNDEVLTLLGITAEWRINKPGVDHDMYLKLDEVQKNQYYDSVISKDSDYSYCRKNSSHKKEYKSSVMSKQIVRDAKTFSKGRMQAKNHGHHFRSI